MNPVKHRDAVVVDIAAEAEPGGVVGELGAVEHQRQIDTCGGRGGLKGKRCRMNRPLPYKGCGWLPITWHSDERSPNGNSTTKPRRRRGTDRRRLHHELVHRVGETLLRPLAWSLALLDENVDGVDQVVGRDPPAVLRMAAVRRFGVERLHQRGAEQACLGDLA